MGDGLLAEFPSVVEAVQCAVEIQQSMIGREADLPDERRIRLRIGVNLGDIIVEGSDIYGDGVNVAARLEGLAEPGGICISGKVYEEVKNKLVTAFEDLGEQEVKNIREPVHVWRWPAQERLSSPAATSVDDKTLALPDKPSIAVLAFENMSGDPSQEYFSDGITEDIITELSRISWLKVIARNSSFSYKGQAVDIVQVGRELGVRYVLEGSVRKAGNRIRVTAQLIDAETDAHVWAERYDRELEDVFAVQDEMTHAIASVVGPEMLNVEVHRARHRQSGGLTAWNLVMQARHAFGYFSKERNQQALDLLRGALRQEPNHVMAHAYVALFKGFAVQFDWSNDVSGDLKDAEICAREALRNDAKCTEALSGLAIVELFNGQFAPAIRLLQQATSLNPNDALAHMNLGQAFMWSDQSEPAIAAISKAIELSPRDVFIADFYTSLAFSYFLGGQFDEALEWAEHAIQENKDYAVGLRVHAGCAAHLGQIDLARRSIARLLELEPTMTVKSSATRLPLKNTPSVAIYWQALRAAGLPEG
jgi:adenylate cyclase